MREFKVSKSQSEKLSSRVANMLVFYDCKNGQTITTYIIRDDKTKKGRYCEIIESVVSGWKDCSIVVDEQ